MKRKKNIEQNDRSLKSNRLSLHPILWWIKINGLSFCEILKVYDKWSKRNDEKTTMKDYDDNDEDDDDGSSRSQFDPVFIIINYIYKMWCFIICKEAAIILWAKEIKSIRWRRWWSKWWWPIP